MTVWQWNLLHAPITASSGGGILLKGNWCRWMLMWGEKGRPILFNYLFCFVLFFHFISDFSKCVANNLECVGRKKYFLISFCAVRLILYMWVISNRRLLKIKIKDPLAARPNVVRSYLIGRTWFKFRKYPSQLYLPTLCTRQQRSMCEQYWEMIQYDVQRGRHKYRIFDTLYTDVEIIRWGEGSTESEYIKLYGSCSPAHCRCCVFPVRAARCFGGGSLSWRINEMLHLSHEKSIFTIYLASCISKAHIMRCWLKLAYSTVFWCIHCHCCDLLRGGCPPHSPDSAHWGWHLSCSVSKNSFFSAKMKYSTQLKVWGFYISIGSNKDFQDIFLRNCPGLSWNLVSFLYTLICAFSFVYLLILSIAYYHNTSLCRITINMRWNERQCNIVGII